VTGIQTLVCISPYQNIKITQSLVITKLDSFGDFHTDLPYKDLAFAAVGV
jgi:hypothetical protein